MNVSERRLPGQASAPRPGSPKRASCGCTDGDLCVSALEFHNSWSRARRKQDRETFAAQYRIHRLRALRELDVVLVDVIPVKP